ncbi:MAG: hypothetical protein ACUZ8H_00605 [Candidatus Anammoxibacter sp.]
MAKSFDIDLNTSPDVLLKKAKAAAVVDGVELSGDTSSGEFSGKGAKGKYKINGSVVSVTITKKPFYAPWPTVEAAIREFFS